ncbi:MAG: hypothetical protein AABY68_06165 [Pseudomonadota bacterium]
MKIIYPNESCISVIHTSGALPLEQVALKDVPYGVPFLFVEDSDVPSNREGRGAWEADFSQPNGAGMGAERWFIAQAEGKINALQALPEPEQPQDVSDEVHAEAVSIFRTGLASLIAQEKALIAQLESIVFQLEGVQL